MKRTCWAGSEMDDGANPEDDANADEDGANADEDDANPDDDDDVLGPAPSPPPPTGACSFISLASSSYTEK